MDNRPTTLAQRELAEMMSNSPRVLQQRAQSDAIHNSPRMVALRHELNALFGGTVRPQGDGTMPAEALPAQREEKTNNTGLPTQLKSGIESLSGMSMDHVKVHYNSEKPAQLQAHAYAQGSEIHVAPGQEQHLPHEAWHVVQQAQGRVRPTLQMKAAAVNDDPSLEKEADARGGKAAQFERDHARNLVSSNSPNDPVIQRFVQVGDVKFTDRRQYGIDTSEGDTDELYVGAGALGPVPEASFTETGSVTLQTHNHAQTTADFRVFEATALFSDDLNESRENVGKNDCLYYAAALANHSLNWSRWNPMRDRDSAGQVTEWDSTRDDGEDPVVETGNVYYLRYRDPTKKPAGQCAHHGSVIVAIDQADKVTSEADASDNRTRPQFNIYGAKNYGGSFYEIYENYYTDQNDGSPVLTILMGMSGSPAASNHGTANASSVAAANAHPNGTAYAVSDAGPDDNESDILHSPGIDSEFAHSLDPEEMLGTDTMRNGILDSPSAALSTGVRSFVPPDWDTFYNIDEGGTAFTSSFGGDETPAAIEELSNSPLRTAENDGFLRSPYHDHAHSRHSTLRPHPMSPLTSRSVLSPPGIGLTAFSGGWSPHSPIHATESNASFTLNDTNMRADSRDGTSDSPGPATSNNSFFDFPLNNPNSHLNPEEATSPIFTGNMFTPVDTSALSSPSPLATGNFNAVLNDGRHFLPASAGESESAYSRESSPRFMERPNRSSHLDYSPSAYGSPRPVVRDRMADPSRYEDTRRRPRSRSRSRSPHGT